MSSRSWLHHHIADASKSIKHEARSARHGEHRILREVRHDVKKAEKQIYVAEHRAIEMAENSKKYLHALVQDGEKLLNHELQEIENELKHIVFKIILRQIEKDFRKVEKLFVAMGKVGTGLFEDPGGKALLTDIGSAATQGIKNAKTKENLVAMFEKHYFQNLKQAAHEFSMASISIGFGGSACGEVGGVETACGFALDLGGKLDLAAWLMGGALVGPGEGAGVGISIGVQNSPAAQCGGIGIGAGFVVPGGEFAGGPTIGYGIPTDLAGWRDLATGKTPPWPSSYGLSVGPGEEVEVSIDFNWTQVLGDVALRPSQK